jgi:hypothetical protein
MYSLDYPLKLCSVVAPAPARPSLSMGIYTRYNSPLRYARKDFALRAACAQQVKSDAASRKVYSLYFDKQSSSGMYINVNGHCQITCQ